MNIVNINGKSISVKGNGISIINDKVYVNGKLIEEGLSGNIEITFTGDLASLNVDGSATVNGSIHGDVDAGGSVNCGDVGKSVDAGGSVNCGAVSGDIDAGGSVSMKR